MEVSFDANKLIQELNKIAETIEPTVDGTLDTLAEIGASNARSSTLYKNITGRLRSQTKFIKNGEHSRLVIADTPYAKWVEFGNGPPGGRIYPKRAKALRFVVNGQVIFRKWVRTSKPRPFMGNANKVVKSFLPDLVKSDLDQMIRKAKL